VVVILVAGNMLAPLGTWVIDVIRTLSYLGVFALLVLENLFPPIPSEIILPLSGFLVGQGKLLFPFVLLAATAGSVTGALVFYGLGRWLDDERLDGLMHQYGRYLLLRQSDLTKARRWFQRHGELAVLLGRLVPGVRSLISIPAGVTEMPLSRFLLYTATGSAAWNSLLVGLGWLLNSHWSIVQQYVHVFEYLVAAAVVLAVGWFVWKRTIGRHRGAPHSKSPAGSHI
jgi:membrane protein DedA with SNARE-associated domain